MCTHSRKPGRRRHKYASSSDDVGLPANGRAECSGSRVSRLRTENPSFPAPLPAARERAGTAPARPRA
eukprot:2909730-Pleurochrysis_carterae.AAC.1